MLAAGAPQLGCCSSPLLAARSRPQGPCGDSGGALETLPVSCRGLRAALLSAIPCRSLCLFFSLVRGRWQIQLATPPL